MLKPTEEEIAKYYIRNSSEQENTNDESVNGSNDNRSPKKFTFNSEVSRTNEEFDNEREELSNSLKRNQKPSKK